ncbi:signal peptidase I [Faecalibacillus intestinalis]|uniref:signal peptidase I n=1 Tax=Faecalibacillus intestinalis TaxID=1982626 RepID=UPI0035217ED5
MNETKQEMNKIQEINNKQNSFKKDLLFLLLKILLIVCVMFLIFSFVYGISRINDVSMKPAIKDGDLVLYYRLDKNFVSGDVAVFKKENRTTTGRVVAVAGDQVDITKDGLLINGAVQISQDIYSDTTQFKDGTDFPLTVGQGQVFVLGDNRTVATDSRIYGCLNINDIQGKVIGVIRTRGI